MDNTNKTGTTAPPVELIKTVITTEINGRKQYVKSITSSSNGAALIPNYTTNQELAKDFLSDSMAKEYIDAFTPVGMREFEIETITKKLELQ